MDSNAPTCIYGFSYSKLPHIFSNQKRKVISKDMSYKNDPSKLG